MIAVYPGSFDPITLGHVDIIKRISHHYSKVHILIAESGDKKSMFTTAERFTFLQESLADIKNLELHVSSGLTVDFAKKVGAQCIVRGLRVVSDFEYEMVMANLNKKLAPDIETFIIFANPQYNFISSRAVKEIAHHGGNLEGLVPDCVAQAFKLKYANK
ncbi:MAG: pantetheine-phosphate adenylyltransferase [Bdellovibrionales bacterium]|nr:pantetheine-phosphate adenylyltransferase [Bdellovibrionales bacterium]